MLPCRRGALLAKSASFKNIPEDIEIKHEIHTKIYPKAIQKTIQNPSQKWYRKTLKNITKNITNLAILGSHFGPILETFWSLCLRWHVFVEDLFSGTFAGCQKEPKWTPKGCQNDAKWPPHPTFLTHCSVNYASKRLEESWPTFLTHSSVKLFKEWGSGGSLTGEGGRGGGGSRGQWDRGVEGRGGGGSLTGEGGGGDRGVSGIAGWRGGWVGWGEYLEGGGGGGGGGDLFTNFCKIKGVTLVELCWMGGWFLEWGGTFGGRGVLNSFFKMGIPKQA